MDGGRRHEPQRRGRRISLNDEEVDAFLSTTRTCRVATAGADGPHVSPLWFVWRGGVLWLYSVLSSRRHADLAHDPRVAVVVDDGREYAELRGVEISGRARVVGEAPRAGEPSGELDAVETAFAAKYLADGRMRHDGRHVWIAVDVRKIVSWDFRKMPAPEPR